MKSAESSSLIYSRFPLNFGGPNTNIGLIKGDINPMTQLVNVWELLANDAIKTGGSILAS